MGGLACLLCGLAGISFDGNVHLSSGFESDFRAILVYKCVFDPQFAIEMISSIHSDLSFFSSTGHDWRDYLLHDARHRGAGFFWFIS